MARKSHRLAQVGRADEQEVEIGQRGDALHLGDGVAVLAEGLVLSVNPADLAGFDAAERDAHGHVHIDDVNLGEILKTEVTMRLKELGIKTTITAKNIGYELRCADPIPFDMEYTRDLGYSAAEYLISDRGAVMVSMQGGRFVPIPFAELIDPETGRTRVRAVDVKSTRYAIARRYMIRLSKADFEDRDGLAKLAGIAKLNSDQFQQRFEYLVP